MNKDVTVKGKHSITDYYSYALFNNKNKLYSLLTSCHEKNA